MNTKEKLLSLAGVAAIAVGVFASSEAESQDAKKEKCYGIVKAGKNDCAAADGSHSCAGYAKKDSGSKEWVLLPFGACDKIVGASKTPIVEKE
jgi:uncharacterized membrane protein